MRLMSDMLIRAEIDNDRDDVHAVNASAFGTPIEADLVDVLREQAPPIVSLVAEDLGEIVGQIMFSPVSLASDADLKIMGLGPNSEFEAPEEVFMVMEPHQGVLNGKTGKVKYHAAFGNI